VSIVHGWPSTKAKKSFVANSIDSIVDALAERSTASPLAPRSVADVSLNQQIQDLSVPDIVKAALYLWNDDVDGAHTIVQKLSGKTAQLIHAVLHRREPDYSNAKYWYRRVSVHPVLDQLQEKYSDWEPFRFVDWCQNVKTSSPEKSRSWLEEVQQCELEMIARFCLENPKS